MSERPSLFIVTSPLQMICAHEARVRYGLSNTILALKRKQKHEKSQQQLDELILPEEWGRIIDLPARFKSFSIPRFIRQLRRMVPDLAFDAVLYAEYSSWRVNVIMNNISAEREVMFDDGTMTIVEYVDYLKDNRPTLRSKGAKDLALKLQGLHPCRAIHARDNFELFTFFTIPSNRFSVVHNDFAWLRDRIGAAQVHDPEGVVAVLGQGLAGVEGVRVERYLELIEDIHRRHDREVIYFPHRSEPAFVREALQQLAWLDYHDSKKPVEFELAATGRRFAFVYGFSSTALYTIKNIYRDIPVFDVEVKRDDYVSKELYDRIVRLRDFMPVPYGEEG